MASFLKSITKIFSPFVLLAGLLLACLLVVFTVAGIYYLQPEAQYQPVGTAILRVIEAPTSTPVLPTPLPTQTNTPEPGTPLPPTAGEIKIGGYVQVQGTGVDGLRVREVPGLQGKILFLAIESEVFLVLDGPVDADGFTWWNLAAPYDETIGGWAVANYLRIVQNP